MKKYIVLITLTLVFCCQTAQADLYKWVDEKGETQITDYPPPQDQTSKDVKIHKAQPVAPLASEQQNETAKNKTEKKPNVVIYTKNACRDCEKAVEFLKSKNISFAEYNMDEDPTAVEKRKEIDDGDDVPFAVINKNRVNGFSEKVYERVLKMEP
ncbi:MAG: glutaredoxin family protein [Smithella sp.]